MLKVKGLVCSYDGIEVLHGIDLEVYRGEIVGVLGSNGAGKSTMLRAVAGLHKPDKGDVIFNNESVLNLPTHKRVERGLVLVPENRQLFLSMTVRENLELGGYRTGHHPAVSLMEQTLDLFPPLRDRLNQPAGTLSGGEQQMLSIARALMTNPSFLMLDEPSLGLAPLVVDEIYQTLVELSKNNDLTLFIVEQDSSRIFNIAQRVYLFETGQVVFHGAPEQLIQKEEILRKAYLGKKKGEQP